MQNMIKAKLLMNKIRAKIEALIREIYKKIEKASSNVKTFELQPKYADQRCNRNITANNIDEIIFNLKDICELSGEKFILAYSDNPDGILHKYGTDSVEAKEFVLGAEDKIKNFQQSKELQNMPQALMDTEKNWK